MRLKNVIDKNPISVLAGVVIATASATVGVVTYVASNKFEVDKTKLENVYTSEISALKTRIASIERRLGTDEKTYFDLSQLIITPERIKALDQSYQAAEDGSFFYVKPSGDLWKYELTSEGGLAMLKLAELKKDKDTDELLLALGQKNLHLWRREDSLITLSTKPKKGLSGVVPSTINFFPMVAIEVVSQSQLESQVGAIARLLGDDESRTKELSKNLDELLKKIDKETQEIAAAIPNSVTAKPPATTAASNIALEHPSASKTDLEEGQAKLRTEELLGSLFHGDVVGKFLGVLVLQSMQPTEMYMDVDVQLGSVQKKGNVLYLQMSTKYENAKIIGREEPTSLTVDREIFFVTNSKSLYLVQIEVPSFDGRSESYPWVAQWLSGIRIPL